MSVSNNNSVTAFTPAVRTADQICQRDIVDLYNGETIALRIPNFYDKQLCKQITDKISNSKNIEHYQVAPDIKKIGKAVFDAAVDENALEEYYQRAVPDLRTMRALYAPNLSPMDKLRLELQEVWSAGSMLESLHGKTMFCGLTRMFGNGAEARPHQDMAHWDVPDSLPAKTLLTQMAVNTYLSVSSAGGDLELWDFGFRDQEAYNATKTSGDYGLDRNKIGPPTCVLTPDVGDMIIFNAQKIHAVTRIENQTRIAVSCFLAYRGPSQPLKLFS